MNAFVYGVRLQWKLDFRNKSVLLTYYVIPLIFFLFMGGIFSSINPEAKQSLIQSMTIFGISMGALIGLPPALAEFYDTEILKAYKVGKIPLWVSAANLAISATVHLLTMSLVILLAAPILFGAETPEHLGTYFVYLVVFTLSNVLIGTLLGLLISQNSKLSMTTQLMFLPSIMLSGIMIPVKMLPNGLQTVGKAFPATWGAIGMTAEAVSLSTLLPIVVIAVVVLAASLWQIKRIFN